MPKPLHVLAIALLGLPLFATAQPVVRVPQDVPYRDITMIQPNVVAECRELGASLSNHLVAELGSMGVRGERVAALDAQAPGTALDVKITNLVSAGNAFIGHKKSVTIYVEAYRDGKQVGSKVLSRDTMGGAFAGFKGSCQVLDRAVSVLGKDVARWYQSLPAAAAALPAASAASAP